MMRRPRKRLMAEINVVPYIDVMLVLLVIFMITAPLLKQGVEVELPRASSRPLQENLPPLIVKVDEKGRYFLKRGTAPEEAVEPEILAARVAAILRLHPGTPVLVGGDRRVPYGTVVQLMALLQRAGVPSVGLMTEPPHG